MPSYVDSVDHVQPRSTTNDHGRPRPTTTDHEQLALFASDQFEDDGLPAADLDWYHRVYLRSAWWLRRRAAFLRLHPFCMLFEHHRGRPVEVHHHGYSHLGAERDEDLRTLCLTCHARVHGGAGRRPRDTRPSAARSAPAARVRPRRRNQTPIGDTRGDIRG